MTVKTPALMVLGTASHVGKSSLCAGLCRLLQRDGYRVAPFKAQNLSLNSAAVRGGEIGRAQAVQAAACGLEPSVDMNPVLLKPGADGCHVIVQGQPRGFVTTADYGHYDEAILETVRASYIRLATAADVMVIEGAGGAAEINLFDRDLANTWMAENADARCLLVADIERGGAFASLYGAWSLWPQRVRIAGFLINKMHGDRALLGDGPTRLQALTGVPTLGVVPFHGPDLPEEDAAGLSDAVHPGATLRIGVLRWPHLANFTDFEPLVREPGVNVNYVWSAAEIAASDVVILPGTRATMADLTALRDAGLEPWLRAAAAAGRPILGICGGYQMLGATIADPDAIESPMPAMEGLGLLGAETFFRREKRVGKMRGRLLLGGARVECEGYLIQHGRTLRSDGAVLLEIAGRAEGCAKGRIWGVALHGLFDSPGARAAILAQWRAWCGQSAPAATIPQPSLDQRLDAWTDFLAAHLELEAIKKAGGLTPTRGINSTSEQARR